jgi:hypothetical protein
VKGLEIDWIVKLRRDSPTLVAVAVGGGDGDAEPVGVGQRQRRDVVGDRARAVPLPALVQALQVGVDRRGAHRR